MRLEIAIDANLLSVVIAYECLNRTGISGSRRVNVLNEVRGRDDQPPPERFEDLWQVFHAAARRMSTQHVIAEVLRHRKNRLPFGKDDLWSAGATLLEDLQLEEQPCSVCELYRREDYRKILHDIGPTDAGLIFVAEKEKATLLSDDENLRHWGGVRSVPCFSLKQMDYLLR